MTRARFPWGLAACLLASPLAACFPGDRSELERHAVGAPFTVHTAKENLYRCISRNVAELPAEPSVERRQYSHTKRLHRTFYVAIDGRWVEELVLTPTEPATVVVEAYALDGRVDDEKEYLRIVHKCAADSDRN
jgi:hypothetical protein